MRDSHHVLPRPSWPRASLSPRANVIASRLCPCHFFGVACTESSFTQAAKGLSIALANTAQSFRVSDHKSRRDHRRWLRVDDGTQLERQG